MTKLDHHSNQVITPQPFDAPQGAKAAARFKLRAGHVVLMLLAALVFLFILFITLARSVQIDVLTRDLESPERLLPVKAQVSFDSLFKLPVANRTLLLPGEHAVRIQAAGYQSVQQTILVEQGRHQNQQIEMLREPGRLKVILNPDIAAQLRLNGEYFADLPGEVTGVPAGRHQIEVDAPLYRSNTQSFLVQGKDELQQIEVELEPAWSSLVVQSMPSGAEVQLDGQVVGQTPLTTQVEEGLHTLSLHAEKFKTYTQEFTAVAQQDIDTQQIELIPADGILEVASNPNDSAVIVNGVYKGQSPLRIELAPDVPQRIQVYQAGYSLQDQTLSLQPATEQQLSVDLAAERVPVRFSVSPSDAEIVINGVARGKGTRTINLTTLPHRVEVRKAGYVSYAGNLIPTRSASQVVSVSLLTKEQHFWANVPPSYRTDEGQKMVLFKSPGTVQLGSSRREIGRRSNETSYTATLQKHFYVSEHEVTNKQFRRFKPSHNSGNYKRRSLDSNNHPVANISWQDAARYCNWLSKQEGLQPFYQTKAGYISGLNPEANGYRLPTEHEWAWLARNKNDEVLIYPWPDPKKISGKATANYADVNAKDFITFTLANYDDGYKASSPIGRFPANHNGLFDIDGNVAEWVNDWYSANSDLAGSSNLVDYLGPEEGEFHVIRGGSWARGHLPQLRLAYRDYGAKGVHDVGFRIARYVGRPE